MQTHWKGYIGVVEGQIWTIGTVVAEDTLQVCNSTWLPG